MTEQFSAGLMNHGLAIPYKSTGALRWPRNLFDFG
jgi:hypothetical protein